MYLVKYCVSFNMACSCFQQASVSFNIACVSFKESGVPFKGVVFAVNGCKCVSFNRLVSPSKGLVFGLARLVCQMISVFFWKGSCSL